MVRTKSDCNVKAAVKAPRKATALGAKCETPKRNSKKNSGGNSYCPRQTPEWQKPITSFFKNATQGESSTQEIASIDDTLGDPVASSSPAPGCSKDDVDQFLDEEMSENGQKENENDTLGDPVASSSPVPGCSKDDVDQFLEEEMSENGQKENEKDPVTDTADPVPCCSEDMIEGEGEEKSENDQSEIDPVTDTDQGNHNLSDDNVLLLSVSDSSLG